MGWAHRQGAARATPGKLQSSCRVKSIDVLACGSQQAHTTSFALDVYQEKFFRAIVVFSRAGAGAARGRCSRAVRGGGGVFEPWAKPFQQPQQRCRAGWPCAVRGRSPGAAAPAPGRAAGRSAAGAAHSQRGVSVFQRSCDNPAAAPALPRRRSRASSRPCSRWLSSRCLLLLLGSETLQHPQPQPQRIAAVQHEPVKQVK